MQKLWQYKKFDEAMGCVPVSEIYKLEKIWSSSQPLIEGTSDVDSDYEDKTTPDLSIERNKFLYIERKEVGNDFADFMDARLVVLGQALTDIFNAGYIANDISDQCVEILDNSYEKTRDKCATGRWKSAKRKVQSVTIDATLENLIADNLTPIGQSDMIKQVELLADIKAKIDYEINRLY